MCSLLLCNTFLLRCKTKTQIDISMATPCCNIHLHPEDPCLLQSNEGATAQPMIQELASETASNLSCRIVVRQARAQAAALKFQRAGPWVTVISANLIDRHNTQFGSWLTVLRLRAICRLQEIDV
jgi:hypothetical protein